MLKQIVGQPFKLELGSAPSTGYTWELPDPPPGVQLLKRDFILPEGAAVGDGGTQVFELQATLPGHCALRFVLKRRWEHEGVQERIIEIEIAPTSPTDRG